MGDCSAMHLCVFFYECGGAGESSMAGISKNLIFLCIY